jgi:hypothetical protein
MKFNKHTILILFTAIIPLFFSACSSFNYKVEMAPTMRLSSGIYPTYEIDFVGVTTTEKPRMDAYSVDEYFNPENPFRENAEKFTMRFSDSLEGPFTLKKDNPIWDKWFERGVTEVVAISNLPGVWKTKGGAADARKLSLPIDKGRWPDGRDIDIQVNPSGLVLISPLLPPGKSVSWWKFW